MRTSTRWIPIPALILMLSTTAHAQRLLDLVCKEYDAGQVPVTSDDTPCPPDKPYVLKSPCGRVVRRMCITESRMRRFMRPASNFFEHPEEEAIGGKCGDPLFPHPKKMLRGDEMMMVCLSEGELTILNGGARAAAAPGPIEISTQVSAKEPPQAKEEPRPTQYQAYHQCLAALRGTSTSSTAFVQQYVSVAWTPVRPKPGRYTLLPNGKAYFHVCTGKGKRRYTYPKDMGYQPADAFDGAGSAPGEELCQGQIADEPAAFNSLNFEVGRELEVEKDATKVTQCRDRLDRVRPQEHHLLRRAGAALYRIQQATPAAAAPPAYVVPRATVPKVE